MLSIELTSTFSIYLKYVINGMAIILESYLIFIKINLYKLFVFLKTG